MNYGNSNSAAMQYHYPHSRHISDYRKKRTAIFKSMHSLESTIVFGIENKTTMATGKGVVISKNNAKFFLLVARHVTENAIIKKSNADDELLSPLTVQKLICFWSKDSKFWTSLRPSGTCCALSFVRLPIQRLRRKT